MPLESDATFPDRDFVFDPGQSGLAFGDREACLAGVANDLPFRLCSDVRPWWPGWHRWLWRWHLTRRQ